MFGLCSWECILGRNDCSNFERFLRGVWTDFWVRDFCFLLILEQSGDAFLVLQLSMTVMTSVSFTETATTYSQAAQIVAGVQCFCFQK